jgi:oligopeptide transport system permease protein
MAVFIGTLYGTVAGWSGGRIDAALMRLVDILYGLPYILLVVLLAVAAGGLIDRAAQAGAGATGPLAWIGGHREIVNIITLLIAIGGVSWLTMARVIRGQVLSLKQQPFMEACRAIGVPLRRQFLRHLLPNLLGPITVYATLTAPALVALRFGERSGAITFCAAAALSAAIHLAWRHHLRTSTPLRP